MYYRILNVSANKITAEVPAKHFDCFGVSVASIGQVAFASSLILLGSPVDPVVRSIFHQSGELAHGPPGSEVYVVLSETILTSTGSYSMALSTR